MFRCFRLILTVALLSIVAHPAAPQTTERNRIYVSGNHDESFVLSIYLSIFAVVDGKEQGMPADVCELTATFTVTEPTGTIGPSVVNMSLGSGGIFHFEVPFSAFVSEGPGFAIIEATDIVSRGSCEATVLGRLTASSDGATRSGQVSVGVNDSFIGRINN